MTTRLRIAALFLATLATACMQRPSPSADSGAAPRAVPPAAQLPPAATPDSIQQIELRTDRADYRPGDKVTMTIVNHANGSWAFNPCTRILEHEQGGSWQAVPDARRCTMEAWILKPNETRTATTNFDSGLEPGRYRLVIGFSGDGPPNGRQATAKSAPVTITE